MCTYNMERATQLKKVLIVDKLFKVEIFIDNDPESVYPKKEVYCIARPPLYTIKNY